MPNQKDSFLKRYSWIKYPLFLTTTILVEVVNKRKKREIKFPIAAAVFVIIAIILHAVGIGGIVFGLIILVWVVCLIIGLMYLILGFVRKE